MVTVGRRVPVPRGPVEVMANAAAIAHHDSAGTTLDDIAHGISNSLPGTIFTYRVHQQIRHPSPYPAGLNHRHPIYTPNDAIVAILLQGGDAPHLTGDPQPTNSLINTFEGHYSPLVS